MEKTAVLQLAEKFTKILINGNHYYQSAKHLNPRAVANVVLETNAIIDELKVAGVKFDAFKEYVLTVMDGKLPDKNDPYFTMIEKHWNEG